MPVRKLHAFWIPGRAPFQAILIRHLGRLSASSDGRKIKPVCGDLIAAAEVKDFSPSPLTSAPSDQKYHSRARKRERTFSTRLALHRRTDVIIQDIPRGIPADMALDWTP